jgi:predicted AlkP superfamily phosphohydrolase/phosphomutase
VPPDAPLRIVVFDGAEHRVLRELMAAGRMPVLEALRARGATVSSETVGGVFEEAVWPTVFSGTNLGDHATQHFAPFDPATHGLRLERERVGLEPFWLHLPDRGREVLAVDLPQVHPHPDSRAQEICCWSAWSAAHRPHASPKSLVAELGHVKTRDWFHEFRSPPSLADERLFSARCASAVLDRSRRVAPAMARRRIGCVGVQELHGVAHLLGHHWLDDHPHRPWPREPGLITAVYEAADAALGPLVEDPAVNVVLLTAQGFGPSKSSNPVLDGLLERAGLSVPAGSSDGSPAHRASRRRVDPMGLLRRWLPAGLRERLAVRVLPESLQQRLMAQQFRDHLDWAATRAFRVPSWTTGYIRINLAGREGFGNVPPAAYEPLLAEVTSLVLGLVEADGGAPMVKEVIPMRARFPGARAEALPDLAVVWALDRPIRRVSHPQLGAWEADSDYHRFRWSDHHGGAVTYLAGPDIRPSEEVRSVDIAGAAATFLRLVGVRPPSTLRAGPWDEVLR